MHRPGLVLAWCLSVLGMALESLSGGELAVEGASRLGLALLPWVALAGVPRAGGRGGASAVATLAVAMPPLALAAGLDRAEGADARILATALAAGAVSVLVLAWAGARARGIAYAAAWFALLPGSAALVVALRWAALPAGTESAGAADALVSALAALDPLVACYDGARHWAWASTPTRSMLGPLGTLALLVVLAARSGPADGGRER